MRSHIITRWFTPAALAALAATAAPATQAEGWRPTTLFLQAGAGEQQTREYFAGAAWSAPWHQDYGRARLDAYVESGFGRWVTDRAGERSSAWLTQLSLTPVLRARPRGAARRWFGELGIGANLILPVYQSERKRFSTTFNFGDHLGAGRYFGRSEQHELSLRLEHFSNAGIQEPNPGENFVQVRYAWHLPAPDG